MGSATDYGEEESALLSFEDGIAELSEEEDSLFEDVEGFTREALDEGLPAGAEFLAVTIPAPYEALEKFLRIVQRDYGFLWRSPSGAEIATGGCARHIPAAGDDRFRVLRREVEALWPTIAVRNAPGTDAPPMVVGGAAFAPHVPPIEPWDEFATDAFTLPRWTYRRDGIRASLTLTVSRDELAAPGAVAALIDETRELVRTIALETATSRICRLDIPFSALHQTSREDWAAYVGAIQSVIGNGEFDKIVAARRCVVDLAEEVEDTVFMARLFASYPDCTHFAVRRERSTFLGATPETLFRKTGNTLKTHALAGTRKIQDGTRSDSTRDAAALSRSPKDLAEHGLVVKKICEDLFSMCRRIRYGSSPHARQVRNLVHLQTPISAELLDDVHAFDLVDTLHPTPAVGGFPAATAADWIRRHEPQERGWYTGIVGWVDASGDAEFGVSIRCGVLTSRRAYVFSGAGIVQSSRSDAEYDETADKMQPILRALGLLPGRRESATTE